MGIFLGFMGNLAELQRIMGNCKESRVILHSIMSDLGELQRIMGIFPGIIGNLGETQKVMGNLTGIMYN